jgi:type IV secretion system protein TrbG
VNYLGVMIRSKIQVIIMDGVMFNLMGIGLLTALLTGCATYQAKGIDTSWQRAERIQYKPVVLQAHPAHFQLQNGNPPALEKAYQTYLKTGKAPNIITEGFVQYAYGASQPIVPASPLELTVISLEPGESVTNVSSGDPMRWSYSLAYSGEEKLKQAHIMVKPSYPDISTDLVITTDKRFYTLKLFSRQNSHYYRDVQFWYPEELQKKCDAINAEKSAALLTGDSPFESDNQLDVNHLNFDYRIKQPFFSSSPPWNPVRIFDDGRHTYIQFPATLYQSDLPALFIQSNRQMMVANYRVKAPYFIIDRIFKRAVLISGSGNNQQKLTLINQHCCGSP